MTFIDCQLVLLCEVVAVQMRILWTGDTESEEDHNSEYPASKGNDNESSDVRAVGEVSSDGEVVFRSDSRHL